MDLKEEVKTLEKSEIFKKFKKENPTAYLANLFSMIEINNNAPEWHIGYYVKEKERIITFVMSDKIIQNPESEVFREKGHINPLDISNIKIGYKTAIENAITHQKQKYPIDTPIKKIILVQDIDGKELFNMTFVTQSFKTLNIKLEAHDGKIIESKIYSIFDFDRKDK